LASSVTASTPTDIYTLSLHDALPISSIRPGPAGLARLRRLLQSELGLVARAGSPPARVAQFADDIRRSRSAPAASRRRIRLARRSEEHTSELQSLTNLVCRLLLAQKT